MGSRTRLGCTAPFVARLEPRRSPYVCAVPAHARAVPFLSLLTRSPYRHRGTAVDPRSVQPLRRACGACVLVRAHPFAVTVSLSSLGRVVVLTCGRAMCCAQ